MGRARVLALIAAALVVGGLVAAVVRVNDEREQLAAQLAAWSGGHRMSRRCGSRWGGYAGIWPTCWRRTTSSNLYIGKLARDAAAAPAYCPSEVRNLLRPYFADLYIRIRVTGEDQFLPSELRFFWRLCGGPPPR